MGDPKKRRKKYQSPRKRWDKLRIESENKIKEAYGLKNKKEIWKAESVIRNKRKNARHVLALPVEERKQREKELLDSLINIGVLRSGATLEDVLVLTSKEFFERRLQTIAWRKGLALTPKQARQFIIHGHIGIKGKRVTVPSYVVSMKDESSVSYFGKPIPLDVKKEARTEDVPKQAESEVKKAFEEAKGAVNKNNKSEKSGGEQ